MANDKFLCIMAGYDNATEARLSALQQRLYDAGFVGTHTKNIPQHATIGFGDCANEAEMIEKVRQVALGYEYTCLRMKQLTALRKLGRNGDPICNMSLAGDILEAAFHKIPLPPGSREFWASWDKAKHPLTPAERLQILREANLYGERFGRFLIANAEIFPGGAKRELVHENKGIRPWRKQVKKLLAEAEKEEGKGK